MDLLRETLLRSYRAEEWTLWFGAAGIEAPPLKGPVFDSSIAMMSVAEQGLGVALAPPSMFMRMLEAGTIVQPFAAVAGAGGYWLTWLKSRQPTASMQAFRLWIEREAASAVAPAQA
jgi:LysR family transcriptional regulator of beta-lactamase